MSKDWRQILMGWRCGWPLVWKVWDPALRRHRSEKLLPVVLPIRGAGG